MATTNCGNLLNKRRLIIKHKAHKHVINSRQVRAYERKKQIAIQLKQSLHSMHSKLETMIYIVK